MKNNNSKCGLCHIHDLYGLSCRDIYKVREIERKLKDLALLNRKLDIMYMKNKDEGKP